MGKNQEETKKYESGIMRIIIYKMETTLIFVLRINKLNKFFFNQKFERN